MVIPKRIVFSRKGFDSTTRYGGRPSPILNGERFVSLPIPEDKKKTIQYSDLRDPFEQFLNLGAIVEQLTKGKVEGDRFVHLDPDLRLGSLNNRPLGWRPIFGQVDQAQTHLFNQGVTEGDLFLFYGLFRDVVVAWDKIEYVPAKPRKHVIWGWMAVGDVLTVRSEADGPAWASYHAHFTDQRAANNTVYLASDCAFETLPGAGVFRDYHPRLCLTDLTQQEVRASLWSLPKWCAPRDGRCPLTYHPNTECWRIRNDDVLLKTRSPGQEFVLHTEAYPEAVEWAKALITLGTHWTNA